MVGLCGRVGISSVLVSTKSVCKALYYIPIILITLFWAIYRKDLTMNLDWKSLLERLKEKSTWLGLLGVAGVFGISPESFNVYVLGITAVAGVLLTVISEKKK